jgi:hypothetical protein
MIKNVNTKTSRGRFKLLVFVITAIMYIIFDTKEKYKTITSSFSKHTQHNNVEKKINENKTSVKNNTRFVELPSDVWWRRRWYNKGTNLYKTTRNRIIIKNGHHQNRTHFV